jgi:diaminopimelate decarboxylase
MLSIADPSGRAVDAARDFRGRLIVSCETVDQVAAAPPRAEIAIRISASITGRDPAIGAILDGTGHRRSRFGLDTGQLAAITDLARAAAGRPVGLHVHHGAVTATAGERFVATAHAALAAADRAGVTPRFVNLGGAWHGLADLAAALRAIRAAIAGSCELILEPGRRIADGAGFASGRITLARPLDDRQLCVVDLSRICHLRWSPISLVAAPAHNDRGQLTLFVGPTCFEDDALGEWTIDPHGFAAGARVIVRDVTGYAVGWNTGFGGIAPADVVIC